MEETPIKNLIDRWGTRKQLADEIGASLASVHKWAKFDRIPANWQAAVIQAAQSQGFVDITAEWMVLSHAQEPRDKAGRVLEAYNLESPSSEASKREAG